MQQETDEKTAYCQLVILILLIVAGNICLIIAGWEHREQANMATYVLWLMISSSYTFGRIATKEDPSIGYAFILGNVTLIGFAGYRGGWTFNLGVVETIVLTVLTVGLGVWGVYGAKKKWNGNWLVAGAILADILSFYPLNKEYFGPNDPPSAWIFYGLGLFVLSYLYSLIYMERTPQKMWEAKESKLKTILGGGIQIENIIFLLITMYAMSG